MRGVQEAVCAQQELYRDHVRLFDYLHGELGAEYVPEGGDDAAESPAQLESLGLIDHQKLLVLVGEPGRPPPSPARGTAAAAAAAAAEDGDGAATAAQSSPSGQLLLTYGPSTGPGRVRGSSPVRGAGAGSRFGGGANPGYGLRDELTVDAGRGGVRGRAGLANLGNTCFMNSALQCLCQTPPLVDYFLCGRHTAELNADNPLGLGGELAQAFGALLAQLWAEGAVTVAPRAFKARLAKFAPQFTGYNQHDSQEFLAYLLDGLHEDLNRVRQKPYVPTAEANGRPDAVVAAEAWAGHRARNDSVIVDTCQAQYRSTLVCPDCGHTSVTYDPYMYLSLPLPAATTTSFRVTLARLAVFAEQIFNLFLAPPLTPRDPPTDHLQQQRTPRARCILRCGRTAARRRARTGWSCPRLAWRRSWPPLWLLRPACRCRRGRSFCRRRASPPPSPPSLFAGPSR